MVAIPGVKDGFLRVAWNGSGLVEWGGAMVCLSCGMFVQLLEVDGPPQGSVFLGAYHVHHAVTPRGDLLQNSKADVTVQPSLNFVLPVNGDGDGSVVWFGDGVGVDAQ